MAPHNQTLWLKEIVDQLVKMIFSSEDTRIAKYKLEMVKRNRELGGNKDGFFFQGILYSDMLTHLSFKGDRGSIYPELEKEMLSFVNDINKINYDKVRINQALSLLIRDCKDNQDLRDALPNSLVSMVPSIANIPRQREEAYILKDNKRTYNQYMKIRSLIEFYVTAKLLY